MRQKQIQTLHHPVSLVRSKANAKWVHLPNTQFNQLINRFVQHKLYLVGLLQEQHHSVELTYTCQHTITIITTCKYKFDSASKDRRNCPSKKELSLKRGARQGRGTGSCESVQHRSRMFESFQSLSDSAATRAQLNRAALALDQPWPLQHQLNRAVSAFQSKLPDEHQPHKWAGMPNKFTQKSKWHQWAECTSVERISCHEVSRWVWEREVAMKTWQCPS